ncbi:opine metallophore biosynthesis dehydrogenase [Paenibacillus sp. N4]|uniref:opine metallophore biosynthesis dehydrogenase n=1 Tax=Paenibacillus vietnamensis TaxID=2590547 RepID=UPI001CD13F29|nr:opine metallophore biosynthesis dehydrogenase [Paenibacillus vietnamensis]MCA0756640.1 opine metallophore biosynthesis dehydrogenase [Paenibacillus vietnamensis]
MKGFYEATPFGNTLIIGAGPAGIHAAVDWSRVSGRLGLLNRKGRHADRVKEALQEREFHLACEVSVAGKRHLSGTAKVDRFYEGYQELDDIWHTVVICTPSDRYAEVIVSLRLEKLREVKRVILLSPGIGSGAWVRSLLGGDSGRIEVVSFSTYYAASKFSPDPGSMLKPVVKGMKRRVYIGSGSPHSPACQTIKALLETIGVDCIIAGSPLEAESRSITTYVHPPFFMSEFSLEEIFSRSSSKKSMYKLYPEGPITPLAIRTMVLLWKEITRVMKRFKVQPLNLLKFLNDDNYPVCEQSIGREEIERFPDLEQHRQEYLLYVRYASLLIDPFSEPDEQGSYFDFSAVPFKQVSMDKDGCWTIPRIPFEDYRKLKLLFELGQRLGVRMPQSQELLERFERIRHAFVKEQGANRFRPEWFEDHTKAQADAIFDTVNPEGGKHVFRKTT